VWLEGLGQLKNPVASTGIEPMTFKDVAYCLYHLTVTYVTNRVFYIRIIFFKIMTNALIFHRLL
jgi:hypothetical protein